jgi:hypothetical protein
MSFVDTVIGGRMPRTVALVFPVLMAACAAAPHPESSESQPCGAAAARVEYLLRERLESHLESTRRGAATGAPELSAEAAEERVKARSDAWTREHRGALVRSCGEWSEDRFRCVMTAPSAAALNHCGLEDFVRSYTDAVISDHAARPLDAFGATRR